MGEKKTVPLKSIQFYLYSLKSQSHCLIGPKWPSPAMQGPLITCSPFCVLTHTIRTLLAEKRKIRQDLGVYEHDVGCKPGLKASLDVTLIYTFYSLSALFIRGAGFSKPLQLFRPGLHKLYPFDFYLSANR